MLQYVYLLFGVVGRVHSPLRCSGGVHTTHTAPPAGLQLPVQEAPHLLLLLLLAVFLHLPALRPGVSGHPLRESSNFDVFFIARSGALDDGEAEVPPYDRSSMELRAVHYVYIKPN